jgi:hypothetical protein
MNRGQRKWAILAMAGTMAGMAAMLLFFRSIPLAAGTATAVIVGIIIKHVALAMIVGSPLAALFQSLKPKIRVQRPFTK